MKILLDRAYHLGAKNVSISYDGHKYTATANYFNKGTGWEELKASSEKGPYTALKALEKKQLDRAESE